MFPLVLLVLLVITYLIYDTSKRYDMIKYGAKLPGDFALPFIGNFLDFLDVKDNKGIFYKFVDLAEKYADKGLYRVWVGQTLAVVLFQPSHLEIVANLAETSTKGPIYYSAVGNTYNGVVVASGGPRWRELRKPITKSMKSHYLDNFYFKVFVRRTNDYINFVKKNREGKTFDCIDDFTALFFDFFCETHFGVPLNEVWDRKWNYSEKAERVVKYSVLGTVMYGLYFWQYIMKLSKKSAGVEEDKRNILAFLKWILNEREKIINSSPKQKNVCEFYTDFLLRRRKENNLTEKQICYELGDMVEAGVDTSSLFVASALLYLAMHPEIQERVYQEQLDIFGDSARDATLEDIDSMKYLEMVFKETCRHVSNQVSFRICTADIKLDNYTIPKGAVICAYFHKARTDPKYWEKPNVFYPEHFLPEKEAARHKFAYAPFGIGIRMCAGKQYGFLSSMVALSTILRNYKLTTPLKYEDLLYELSTFTYIHQRYKIKLQKRNTINSTTN